MTEPTPTEPAQTEPAPLTFAVAQYPHTRQLTQGPVTTRSGLTLAPVTVKPIIAAFRRMIRDLEFDVCEVAVTTYLVAREAGIPIIALPVFLNRKFHHGDVMCRPGSGITGPKDLEGRKVGVRAYSVTTGAWVRGILHEQFGVDLDSITWLVDDEEHVESLQLPGNVQHVGAGTSVAQLFNEGGIDAALSGRAGIGRTGAPTEGWDRAPATSAEAYPLFEKAAQLQRDWFAQTGCYPIHGVLTVKAATVARHPELVADLWQLFTDAKADLLRRIEDPADTDADVVRYRAQRDIVGPDPLPFGLEANRPSIEAIIRFSHDQGLLAGRPEPEAVFVAVD
jgi:4,5-dihydroxyphthalate decarboxylase